MDFLSHRYAAIALLSVGLVANPVQAQVIPDNTLPTAVSSLDNRNFAIEGGARSGNNLFHSFSQFSIPTTGSAVFDNAVDVQNIFSRITGGNVSNINGLIQANGTANLFLLNPSGILFGSNASLNIGGSFLGTTAQSIKFGDGTEFSTVNPNGTGLLTISLPIGLQFGTLPAPITVQGTGHRLSQPSPILPIQVAASANELRGNSGSTLALIGGEIALDGGILSIEQGQIALVHCHI
jgi:filamentous hemagglutinin family protein